MNTLLKLKQAQTIAEQLQPHRRQLRQRHASVVSVSQVLLEIQAQSKSDRLVEMRNSVLRWMSNRVGKPLPKGAWSGESFEIDEVGAQRAAAVMLDEPQYWAARLDDADKSVPRRTWVTEVGVARQSDEQYLFGARLVCTTRGENPRFERSLPGFVRQIITQEEATLDGVRVTSQPWIVRDEQTVDQLVDLLERPARRANVIVLSLPESSEDENEAIISASELCSQTLGVAHVAVITGPAAFHLSDRVGKQLSVFQQAVRTYKPGFNLHVDEPFSHPLALPQRVMEWSDGRSGYCSFLIGSVLSDTVKHGNLEAEVPSYAQIRHFAARRRLESARDSNATERELLQMFEEDNARLSSEIDDLKQTSDSLRADVEEERDRAWKHVFRLRQRVEALQATRNEQGETPDTPTTLDDFEKWASQNVSEAVELTSRAIQGVKKSQYSNPKLLYQALLLLCDYYVPMRRYGGEKLRSDYSKACQKLGLEETPTISSPSSGEQGETYFVNHAGKRELLARHLKRGNSREPRHCFRLYFFWDDDAEQVVVGWLPSHLRTRKT